MGHLHARCIRSRPIVGACSGGRRLPPGDLGRTRELSSSRIVSDMVEIKEDQTASREGMSGRIMMRLIFGEATHKSRCPPR